MELVRYWRWRYRDPVTGQICRTTFQLSQAQAGALLPEAERIEGSDTLCEVRREPIAEYASASVETERAE